MQDVGIAGLSQSVAAGVISGVVVFGYFLIQVVVDIRRDVKHEDYANRSNLLERMFGLLFGSFLMAVPAVAVAASVFCAAYSVLNLLLRGTPVSVEALQADLAAGTLTLRIVSVILLLKTALALARFANDWNALGVGLPWHGSSRESGDLLYANGSGRPISSLDDAVSSVNRNIVVAAQYCFYLAVLTLLWTLSASGVESFAAVVLSFALLFIVDDWVIISDYYESLNGRILRAHRLRITIANWTIAPIAIAVSFAGLSVGYALIASAIVVGSLALRLFAEATGGEVVNRLE